jgi:diguanylate cyclase (GGDEF)-like protein
LGPVLVVTRQGLELRNPASGWPVGAGFALTGAIVSATVSVVWPTPFAGRSIALTAVLTIAAVVSAGLSFRTATNNLQPAPTVIYVVAASVLVGPLAAIVVGAAAGARAMISPRPAQLFTASLGATQGAAAGIAVALLASPGMTRHPLAVCVAAAAAAGATWFVGHGVMYRFRGIPFSRLWRVEVPSSAAEITIGAGAAPAIVLLYGDVGFAGVVSFAAILIAAFAVFRRYRYHLLYLQAELERLSMSDPLTGTANRRAFDERLEHECRRTNRGGSPFALLLIDLDHFKEINDRQGHAAGDYTIKQAASRLGSRLRGEDLLARIGGDELAVIATEVTDINTVETLSHDLTQVLESEPVIYHDRSICVTASVGIAIAATSSNPDDLLRTADAALYAAKASGRNRFVLAGTAGPSTREPSRRSTASRSTV